VQDGKTALHLAAAAGNMAVVSYLLDIGSFFSQDKVRQFIYCLPEILPKYATSLLLNSTHKKNLM
jgi:ankyrin repeat protein